MKWGVRRFQDYNGHKIKDGDIFLKENTSITRYTTHKRDFGKYMSFTKNDSERYENDGIAGNLNFKVHKSLYKQKIRNLSPLKIKNGESIVEDIVNRIGDTDLNVAFNYLKENNHYYLSGGEKYRRGIKNGKNKYFKNQAKVAKALNKYMKTNFSEVLKEYRDKGYDAIVDPEDATWNYDMPIIMLNTKKIKRESIIDISNLMDRGEK